MMDFDLYKIIDAAMIWTVPIVLAVTLHEAAHGWVASKLGDNTAKAMGRVTFNPFKHIHLFGTIILPVVLLMASGGKYMFGFAKPVPVNFHNLRHPRRDMVLVAAAGPGANILISVLAGLAIGLFGHAFMEMDTTVGHLLFMNLYILLKINIILAIFNLMPLPPLDGGRIAVGLLPQPFSRMLAGVEKSGFLIILFALFILPQIGDMLGMNWNVLLFLVGVPSDFVSDVITAVTGADDVLRDPLFRWWANH